MKSFGYVLILLAIVACGIVWQVLRRLSAGTQALINPERYAIQKVVEMQQLATTGTLALESASFPAAKWSALVKYDPEIAPLAEQLRPFGDKWVWALGYDFFALEEDRSYLPHILQRLIAEATKEQVEEVENEKRRKETERWAKFRKLYNGEACDDSSLAVLRKAEQLQYAIDIRPNRTIIISRSDRGTSYVRSNADIQAFGRFMAPPRDISKELSQEAISALRKASDRGYSVSFSPDKGAINVRSPTDGWQIEFSSNAEIIKFGQDLR